MPAQEFASQFPRGSRSGKHLAASWRQSRSPDYGAVALVEDHGALSLVT